MLCYVMFFRVFSVFGVLLRGIRGVWNSDFRGQDVEQKKFSGLLSIALTSHTL